MCGCGGNIQTATPTPQVQRVATHVQRTPVSTSVSRCNITNAALQNIGLKVLDLIKFNKAAAYIEANIIIRGWIRDLGTNCPNQIEFDNLETFIINEYDQHIQP